MTDPVTVQPTDRDWGRLDVLVDEDPIALRDAAWRLATALAAAEHRATRAEARIRHLEATAQITVREALRAEASRDEWRQTALDERGAALDLLEQIKVRDRRIQAVQHLVDQADHAGNWTVTCAHLQRAIDGTNPTIERQETR